MSVVAAACGSGHPADACRGADRLSGKATFVFVESPRSGDRVRSGFRVRGCSSTFEADVVWRLRARNGRLLAHGFTQGGSLQPAQFQFTVGYSVAAEQVGQLEVDEPRVTNEGLRPMQNVLPLVLEP